MGARENFNIKETVMDGEVFHAFFLLYVVSAFFGSNKLLELCKYFTVNSLYNPVYNMERTICDLIRGRNHMEIQTFQGALKQYAGRKDKNLRNLMQYAAMFHVDNILRQYLEVLL